MNESGSTQSRFAGARRFVQVALAVGRVTFFEVVRDKVLYNVLLAAVLLFGVGFLASRLSSLSPGRVIIDFGLSALSISSLMVAILVGAGLLGREFERRTIHVALSHPISRLQFVAGKYVGLSGVLFVNWLLFVILYGVLLWGQTGHVFAGSTVTIAVVLALFQTLLMGAVAILLSSISTTSLAVILSVGSYLVGTNISELRLLAVKIESPVGKWALNSASLLFPNLEFFNLGTKVTYDLPVAAGFFVASMAYALVYSALCVGAAGLLAGRREI